MTVRVVIGPAHPSALSHVRFLRFQTLEDQSQKFPKIKKNKVIKYEGIHDKTHMYKWVMSQTCLVKRVCTEDKSRPRSSDRAIPSLSPAKYNESVERF